MKDLQAMLTNSKFPEGCSHHHRLGGWGARDGGVRGGLFGMYQITSTSDDPTQGGDLN